MTIKEMIIKLEEIAHESENGENAIVEFYSEEEGTYPVSEMFVTTRETVLIQ